MKKRLKAVMAVVCLALLLNACADKPDTDKTDDNQNKSGTQEEKEAPKEKEYQGKLDVIEPSAYSNGEGLHLEKGAYISIIGKSKEGQFWEEVEKGAQQAAEDINAALGYEGKDKVKVTYSGPANADDVDEQVNILDEELARYPVAVGISIADAQACEVQFDLATESDIPVVAYDSGSDYKGLMAMVSTDNQSGAKLAAEKLGEMMSGKGEVALFVHDSKSKAASERETAFLDAMKEQYPEITITTIFHMDDTEEIKEQMIQEIKAGTYDGSEKLSGLEEITADDITQDDIIDYIFLKHPDLKGCYATNGDAVKCTINAIDRLENVNVMVVGYDGDEEELEALKAGKIDGLIVQNPFGMGYAAVIAAARASLSMGNEAYVNTGYTWVTKENMDTAEVKKMLY